MWIVDLALRRPYAVGVACLLLFVLGAFSASRMKTDVLPVIDIPVAMVIWNYPGLPAEDMEKRIVQPSERSCSLTVNGVSKIESKSVSGVGILKLYFEPGADIGLAIAQINSASGALIRTLPPGTFPPIVLPYNAGNVPVAQLTVSGPTHPEEEVVDFALGVRLRLFTIPGLAVPVPYGGKFHQINVDMDSAAAAARGVSAQDIVQAVLDANPNLPGATARLAGTQYDVAINNNPANLDELRRSPVRVVNGVPIRLGDVANVYEGTERQEDIVRVNGRRATYLAMVRKTGASTLAVVDAAKSLMPLLREQAPEGMEVHLDLDQSIFVRAAMVSVLREAGVAAVLVTLLTFLALGSWRAVAVVATSIPLAGCAALAGLHGCGMTLNLMTLGGLSLAVGMVVDDATVEVENIHRQMRLGKPLRQAIVDGAGEIAMPALASTLAICVVFAPVVLLTGPAHYLFVPLALAVVFAMLASYVLSRTLVPTLAHRLFRDEDAHPDARSARERAFEWLRAAYARSMRGALDRWRFTLGAAALALVAAGSLAAAIGVALFPDVDTGRMRLHVRAPLGTRLEETEHVLDGVEKAIRDTIPADQIETINDTIGLPGYFNLAFIQTDSIGPEDADLLIALRPGHAPTADYKRALRRVLPAKFPTASFYFQSPDIISQVLDFGASAPIDVKIEGRDLDRTGELARAIVSRVQSVPGTVDVRIAQPMAHPALKVDVDRERAGLLGVSQRDVAAGLLTSLNSSEMIAPTYWIDPETNTSYLVAVQSPPLLLHDIDDVRTLPIPAKNVMGFAADDARSAPPLQNVAKVQLARSNAMVSHENVQRTIDVQCDGDGRDLAAIAKDVERAIADMGPPPAGVRVAVRGRIDTLNEAMGTLKWGLLVAAALAYLLMVVLFHSWTDPLIVMVAVPGALAGVLVALVVTGSTLNVESFMGAIMAIGLATANSILVVSFAKQVQASRGASSIDAAIEAGATRLRPVLMTAGAMILGMLPIAIGAGDAGEQNAPLGRAVIGGLIGATLATLWLVPTAYALARRKGGSVLHVP